MSNVQQLIPMVLDPRGRCNRKGLLVLMLVTLLMQSLLGAAVFGLNFSLTGPVALVIKLAFVWVAVSASIQRLHDTGRSGWLLLPAIVGIVIWLAVWGALIPIYIATTYGFGYIQLYSPLFFTFMAVAYVPVIAAALWLHFKKGESGPNRFGAVPGNTGFSRRLQASVDKAASNGSYEPVTA